MKIENVSVKALGCVWCKSRFYVAQSDLSYIDNYKFSIGLNNLSGEIDSGGWAVSYLMSMYTIQKTDFVMYDTIECEVNGLKMSIEELSNYCCYMDYLYPLYSNKSIKQLIIEGIESNNIDYSLVEILDLFGIDSSKSEKTITQIGNDVFKAMAAVGYCHNKQIFCFPWLSKKRISYYGLNVTYPIEVLKKLNMIVVYPCS